MRDLVTALLLLAGGAFMALGGLGIVRLPDAYSRLQAAAKTSTLGVTLLLAAVAVHFASWEVAMRSLAVVVFTVLTAPVAAHLVGRAAFFTGVPLWEGTVKDELREHLDRERGEPR